ncbi:MAG: hypothetical protein HFF09_05420 [Oscillospiraceae bacterium]|nr:hypothetical protein [Oscillospiraceae bacterium]
MGEPIPIYLINGFLDAGKTSFIRPMLEGNDFTQDERTLLLLCEEGEEEYDAQALQYHDVSVVMVEEQEELTGEFLRACKKKYRPTQIVIEWNGMWGMEHIIKELPRDFDLYQIVTLVDAGTFENYAANLGPVMMEKILNTDMVIFNRCTNELKERLRKRNLKMLNRRAEMYLEFGPDHAEPYDSGLPPFDMSGPVLELDDRDYGVWYVDVMDHPERYEGKSVRFCGMVAKSEQFPKGSFVAGRFAMVCCAEDTTFLGMICKGPEHTELENKDWVEVTAKVKCEYVELYKGDGPILYTEKVERCLPPKEELVTF